MDLSQTKLGYLATFRAAHIVAIVITHSILVLCPVSQTVFTFYYILCQIWCLLIAKCSDLYKITRSDLTSRKISAIIVFPNILNRIYSYIIIVYLYETQYDWCCKFSFLTFEMTVPEWHMIAANVELTSKFCCSEVPCSPFICSILTLVHPFIVVW